MNGPDSSRHTPAKVIGSETGDGSQADRGVGEIGFVVAVTLLGGWLRLRALGRDSLGFDEVG
jgi:hypothetical protein